jgi:hypothetical protein
VLSAVRGRGQGPTMRLHPATYPAPGSGGVWHTTIGLPGDTCGFEPPARYGAVALSPMMLMYVTERRKPHAQEHPEDRAGGERTRHAGVRARRAVQELTLPRCASMPPHLRGHRCFQGCVAWLQSPLAKADREI